MTMDEMTLNAIRERHAWRIAFYVSSAARNPLAHFDVAMEAHDDVATLLVALVAATERASAAEQRAERAEAERDALRKAAFEATKRLDDVDFAVMPSEAVLALGQIYDDAPDSWLESNAYAAASDGAADTAHK